MYLFHRIFKGLEFLKFLYECVCTHSCSCMFHGMIIICMCAGVYHGLSGMCICIVCLYLDAYAMICLWVCVARMWEHVCLCVCTCVCAYLCYVLLMCMWVHVSLHACEGHRKQNQMINLVLLVSQFIYQKVI